MGRVADGISGRRWRTPFLSGRVRYDFSLHDIPPAASINTDIRWMREILIEYAKGASRAVSPASSRQRPDPLGRDQPVGAVGGAGVLRSHWVARRRSRSQRRHALP